MAIRFKCPNGHKLVANDQSEGQAMQCPKCGRAIVVPAAEHQPMTDTRIVSLLTDQSPRDGSTVWT